MSSKLWLNRFHAKIAEIRLFSHSDNDWSSPSSLSLLFSFLFLLLSSSSSFLPFHYLFSSQCFFSWPLLSLNCFAAERYVNSSSGFDLVIRIISSPRSFRPANRGNSMLLLLERSWRDPISIYCSSFYLLLIFCLFIYCYYYYLQWESSHRAAATPSSASPRPAPIGLTIRPPVIQISLWNTQIKVAVPRMVWELNPLFMGARASGRLVGLFITGLFTTL